MSLLNKLKALGMDTVNLYNESIPSRSAAALAYRAVFSLAPLLLIATMILGIFVGRTAAQEQINSALEKVLTEESAAMVEDSVQTIFQQTGAGITLTSLLGLALLAYGASALFKELKIALHAVWGLPPAPKKGLKANIISQVTAVVMVLMIGFFFLLLIVINLVISLLDSYIFYGELGILQWGSLLGSILVVALLIGFMYRVIPDITLPWSDLWVGALVTTILMMIGIWGIKLYLTHSNVGSAAGTAGALIIMLLGIYYAAQVFLFGASFVAGYAKNFGSERASQALAMFAGAKTEPDNRENLESASP
ncbi:MAG: YihY/virulence factor BrkB family protein [Anaerolineaceae bacterium]|nr:YihY/virulence factor BrkB family protein [Anaerolineaceae bacterium]MCB9100721.1 YihY/virulence factor BrkB family protein [Anaerolineales bacterium]